MEEDKKINDEEIKDAVRELAERAGINAIDKKIERLKYSSIFFRKKDDKIVIISPPILAGGKHEVRIFDSETLKLQRIQAFSFRFWISQRNFLVFKRFLEQSGVELNDIENLSVQLEDSLHEWENKKEKQDEEVFPPEVLEKAEDILKNGNPLSYLIKAIQKVHVGDNEAIAVCAISRGSLSVKNAKKIHLNSCGESGKGKSDLFKKFFDVLPKARKVILQEMSGKTLQYASEKIDLSNYHIYAEEGEGIEQSYPILRSLTEKQTYENTDEEIISWTVRDQQHLELKIKGSQLVWVSSVKPIKDAQLINRFYLIIIDESEEQDERVHAHQKLEEGYGKNDFPKEFGIVKAMFYLLEQEKDLVLIPFIEKIDWRIKQNRRDFPLFCAMIKSCAKLFKFQRKKINGKILATRFDHEVAKLIWHTFMKHQTRKTSADDEKILDLLPSDRMHGLTRNDIYEKLGWSIGKIRNILDKGLCSEERNLVCSDKNDNNRVIYWLSGKNNQSCLSDSVTQVNWSSFCEKDIQDYLENYLLYLKQFEEDVDIQRKPEEYLSTINPPDADNYNKLISETFCRRLKDLESKYDYLTGKNKQNQPNFKNDENGGKKDGQTELI